jgi:hypothetical protein
MPVRDDLIDPKPPGGQRVVGPQVHPDRGKAVAFCRLPRWLGVDENSVQVEDHRIQHGGGRYSDPGVS